MTSFYQPLQRNADKRWDMTIANSSSTYAIGYCRDWSEKNPWRSEKIDDVYGVEYRDHMTDWWDRIQKDLEPFRDRFHGNGHASANEASLCWLDYRLDTKLEFYDDSEAKRLCVVVGCDDWTHGRAHFTGPISGPPIPVCDDHRTRDVIASHIQPAKTSE